MRILLLIYLRQTFASLGIYVEVYFWYFIRVKAFIIYASIWLKIHFVYVSTLAPVNNIKLILLRSDLTQSFKCIYIFNITLFMQIYVWMTIMSLISLLKREIFLLPPCYLATTKYNMSISSHGEFFGAPHSIF